MEQLVVVRLMSLANVIRLCLILAGSHLRRKHNEAKQKAYTSA